MSEALPEIIVRDEAAPNAPLVVMFGGRPNTYESEMMASPAAAAGLGNAVIVNICAVTGEAVTLAAQTVRRPRRAYRQSVLDLNRLRLSSINRSEAHPALIRAIADEERLMPHLHLSLQAGDDLILKRMKRRHLRADAIRFCSEARRLRPEIVFGADLIAGFPTETEALFLNSLDLVEACDLTYLHVFPFSPRKGTSAARMPLVPKAEIKARAARLRQVGGARHTTFSRKLSISELKC